MASRAGVRPVNWRPVEGMNFKTSQNVANVSGSVQVLSCGEFERDQGDSNLAMSLTASKRREQLLNWGEIE